MASPSPLMEPAEGDPSWLAQVAVVLGRKPTAVEEVGGIFCNICNSTFNNKKEFDGHYGQHNLGPDIVYTCVLCRKEMTNYPSFRNHCYLAHVAKDKYKCEHCFKTYSKLSILNSHIETVHNIKCSICKKQFSSNIDLQTHLVTHKTNDQPPYPCRTCNKTIHTIDAYEIHVDDHCTMEYPCPLCDHVSDNHGDASSHLSVHFGDELSDENYDEDPQISADSSIDMLGGIHCRCCDELFKNRVEFDSHYVTEHPDEVDITYSCNICGKQYLLYHLFGDHCYQHVSKGKFECTDCEKSFNRLSKLITHTEAFHSSETSHNKPFSCGECGHAFGSGRRLKEHWRIAHSTEIMRCPEPGCDMAFRVVSELVLHGRAHRARSADCARCALALRSGSAARAHVRVHRRVRYACPVCARTYREKHLLMKHAPTHFEQVLHICKVCGKGFNRRSRLVQHCKVHSELRANVCQHCGKGFVKTYQLQQHLNIHSGAKPYQCPRCPKSFASWPNWHKHLRRVHQVDKQTIRSLNVTPSTPMINNTDNSDSNAKIESGVDSTGSEISLDTYIFVEEDDDTMDSLDPAIIEKDWNTLNENSFIDTVQYTEFTEMTLLDNSLVDTGSAPLPPAEVGPEFNVSGFGACIDLDEHYLPHMDPRLATLPPSDTPLAPHPLHPLHPLEPVGWEPRITKVYHPFDDADVTRRALRNTDIY